MSAGASWLARSARAQMESAAGLGWSPDLQLKERAPCVAAPTPCTEELCTSLSLCKNKAGQFLKLCGRESRVTEAKGF